MGIVKGEGVVYHNSTVCQFKLICFRRKNACHFKTFWILSIYPFAIEPWFLCGWIIRYSVMILLRISLKFFIPKFFFFLFLFSGLSAAQSKEPIDRSFGPIKLGLNPTALQEVVPSIENNAMYLGLIPGERFFEVVEAALPEGVVSVSSQFYKERLYKISVEFGKNWFSDDEWEALVEKEREEYGHVSMERKQIAEAVHEIVRWEDESTVYILRRELKTRIRNKKFFQRSVVSSIRFDKKIWEERVRAESDYLF